MLISQNVPVIEVNNILNDLSNIIPSLNITPRNDTYTNFDELDTSTQIYDIVYLEKRDPTIYTELSLKTYLEQILTPLEGDNCIQIGVCLYNQGDTDSYKQILFNLNTCDNINDDIIVKNYPATKSGEKAMLIDFTNLITTEDPDIITGYNIFNFDWPYLCERAKELDCYNIFSDLSRFTNYKCQITDNNSKGTMGKYLEIPGRVNLDLFKIIQRDFNLDSYKLDNVSSHFIRGNVNNVNIDKQFSIIITDNTVGLKNGNFIQFIIEKGYDTDYLNNGTKYLIEKITDNSFKINANIKIPNNVKCYWTLGKDDITPKQIFDSQHGSSYDRMIIGKYCIMDVVLCIELIKKLKIINNNVGMAKVCSTPLSWIIKRGQGIKILSLVSKTCRNKNFLLPLLFSDNFSNDSYEGAIVLKPTPGIYFEDSPISVLDYASLYPNSMISNNLSHETFCTDKEWLGDDGKKHLESLKYKVIDIEYDNYKGTKDKKVKSGKCCARFVERLDGKLGIIPSILKDLLAARKNTRDKIKYKNIILNDNNIIKGIIQSKNDDIVNIKNGIGELHTINKADIKNISDTYTEFEKSVFDGEQLAYKVTANSLYGQIGARTSSIYWVPIAASTTATGREQLYIAKDFIEKEYPGSSIIYGDTDSVFAKFSLKDSDGNILKGKSALKESIRLGVEAGERISKILKKPQDLEYEKTFSPFILFSKKRYVGNKYEFDINKCKQTSMGIVLKRRDNAQLLKIIYGGIIDIIMNKQKILPAIDFLHLSLRNLIRGKFGLDKLIITKTLNDGYKNPEMIAHKVLADRISEREPGNKPQLYDRIPFAYIQTTKKNPLQGERIEHPDYINKHNLKPDYNFYITNQLMKPISQIFALSITEISKLQSKVFKKPSDYYKKLEIKYKKSGMSNENIEKKIIAQKQKDISDYLFSDILLLCENEKNGNRNINEWFK